MNWKIGWILCILFLMAGCVCDDPLNTALKQAGENRAELEKVLTHYSDNPEKRNAAEFLIRNMTGLNSLDSPLLSAYYDQLDSLQNDVEDHEVIRAYFDSVYKEAIWEQLSPTYDLSTLNSDYLIRHIDAAFRAKESPWANQLTFSEFCEYILPYRAGNERLENWMVEYGEKYAPLIKSLGTTDIDSVYTALDNLFVQHRYFTPLFVPDCKPSSLHKIRIGACRTYVNLAQYLFRSIGIPVVKEFVPNWTNHAMGHEWATIIIDGQNYPFMLGEREKVGNHVKNFVYRAPKIYRTTFEQKEALIADETDVPPLFKSTQIVDVTSQYLPTSSIELPETFGGYGRNRYAYLAVFDLNSWKPVAYGRREQGRYRFQAMGMNAVYLPVFYKKGQIYPAYYPVKVDSTGGCSFLKPDKERLRKVTLRRKFMDMNPKQWADAMIGGYFVFGKNLSFTNGADTVPVPKLHEYAYQTVELKGNYRCMKYVPPAYTKGNIAEIEIYDNEGRQITGKIIGNYNPDWLDSMTSMQKAFDGDVLTFTSADPKQGDAWLGLDFGRPTSVSQLVYLPRSDDNFIKEAELYELFYWDKKWESLGRKTGNRQLQYLVYDNVPDNALLLLRNLTKGKEERIFTYEGEEQVWW